MSKIVVVGANHAGTACINTMLDNLEMKMKLWFLTKTQTFHSLDAGWHFGSVSKSMVQKVSSTLTKKIGSKGAKVYMNSPVLSIDYDNKVVTAEVDGKEHKESYEKLIFATGSTPIIPPIKGVEIVPGNREFKATLENLQFVKLYPKR